MRQQPLQKWLHQYYLLMQSNLKNVVGSSLLTKAGLEGYMEAPEVFVELLETQPVDLYAESGMKWTRRRDVHSDSFEFG